MKDYPVYECPVEKCKSFVVGAEGAHWICAEHGVVLERVNPREEPLTE